jgi:hypothetical protein
VESPVATRGSCTVRPVPDARAPLDYARRFTREEHARIVRGLVPAKMEDKWFVFFEEGWLYLHRSWTGACIYGVRLAEDDDGSVVVEAWVSRAPEEYRRTDDGYDERLLAFLVDRLLLGRSVPFPIPEAIAEGEQAAVYRHHVVGDARANDED